MTAPKSTKLEILLESKQAYPACFRPCLASAVKCGPWVCRGSFATVKKAVCRADESEWAVKIIDKTKLEKEDEDALQVRARLLSACALLS